MTYKLVDGKPLVQNLASDSGVDVNGTSIDEAEPNPKGAQASAWSAPTVSRGGRCADRSGVEAI